MGMEAHRKAKGVDDQFTLHLMMTFNLSSLPRDSLGGRQSICTHGFVIIVIITRPPLTVGPWTPCEDEVPRFPVASAFEWSLDAGRS